MTGLSSLPADQLAEKVRLQTTHKLREWLSDGGVIRGEHIAPERDCPGCQSAVALDELVRRLKAAEDALAFYAERRNYRLASPSPVCDEHGGKVCQMEHGDSYDDGGPGARARAVLRGGSDTEKQP